MRRTRILATIGPASQTPEVIRALLTAGVDAFRLNFSHGNAGDHEVLCRRIREVAEAEGRDIAVLQDLSGPKIRTGRLASPITLETGDRLTIEHGDFVGAAGRVSCAFDALFTSVDEGDRLLLDDGRIELEVDNASRSRLETSVVAGGVLSSSKGINVPTATLRTSALTPKDREDLQAGVSMGVDMVAVSFVQSADDMVAARQAAIEAGAPNLPLVAKIEKPQALANIEDILGVSDAIMIARGDLGVEIPLEQVPAAQRQIVQAARQRGVPVILATQVLESMRTEPRPTRAEVTDAAYAVDMRVDTIMLAGETAAGHYPVRAVSVLDAIIRETERTHTTTEGATPENMLWSTHSRGLCEAAVALADSTGATAIVALTRAGKTARMLSAMRPMARILAVTPDRAVAAGFAVLWGVTGVITTHRAIGAVRRHLLARNLVSTGDVIVFVSAHSVLGHENINFVHVERA
jgi:pyruvate kinase